MYPGTFGYVPADILGYLTEYNRGCTRVYTGMYPVYSGIYPGVLGYVSGILGYVAGHPLSILEG